MDSNNPPFGIHLMLEAYNCPKEVLDDANVAYKILDELPAKIGMTKLTLPYVVHAPGISSKDTGGWSGFVIIAESHISMHTFAKKGYVTVDVYSCKEFDSDYAVSYFKEMFQTEDVDFKVEVRGERFPKDDIHS